MHLSVLPMIKISCPPVFVPVNGFKDVYAINNFFLLKYVQDSHGSSIDYFYF